MSKPVILSLDIGSSSIRASLYDHFGDPVARSRVKVDRVFRPTFSANAAFRDARKVIDDLLEKTSRAKVDITHVATCAFWHSLVGIDAHGKPTTRVLTWADTRSREYSSVLKKRFDEEVVHQRTGAHFHSSFWPAKLLWLRNDAAAVWERTAMWLSFSDYVALKLFGTAVTSVSMASATGIFDQRKCDQDGELLRFLKVKRASLPSISRGGLKLNAYHARRWPRLRDAEWFPAIGDGAADHVGSCSIGRRTASLMIGTSAAMRLRYDGEPPAKLPSGLWCYRIDAERPIIGGALSDGGNLYQKCKRELRVPKDAEDQMRLRGAAAHGISVLPFFFGERSTGYRENARGAIVGSNVEADGVDLLQAAMEGVAFRLAEIYDRLRKVGALRRIVASGGALRDSSVWKQIVADVLGRDLKISATEESASRGAVLLALESLGKIENIDRFSVAENDTLEHHPSCHKAYKKARKLHQAAYEQQK